MKHEDQLDDVDSRIAAERHASTMYHSYGYESALSTTSKLGGILETIRSNPKLLIAVVVTPLLILSLIAGISVSGKQNKETSGGSDLAQLNSEESTAENANAVSTENANNEDDFGDTEPEITTDTSQPASGTTRTTTSPSRFSVPGLAVGRTPSNQIISPTPAARKPAAPSCKKPTNFKLAAPLSISADKPGLHKDIKSPDYYRVYGYTAAEIRAQMNRCSPVSALRKSSTIYQFDSSWWINYRISLKTTSNGRCYVSKGAVGLQQKQILPKWTPSTHDEPGLSAKWQKYISEVKSFNSGVMNISIKHSQNIYLGIGTFPEAKSCSGYSKKVESYVIDKIKALKSAESKYRSTHKRPSLQ